MPLPEAQPVPVERLPSSAIGGESAAAVAAATAGMLPRDFALSRVAELRNELRGVILEAHSRPGDSTLSAARRFALQAAVEAQWSMHWSHVDLAALLRDTSLAAREMLQTDSSVVSQTAAEMRVRFESLEAVFAFYAGITADAPAPTPAKMTTPAKAVAAARWSTGGTARSAHAARSARSAVPVRDEPLSRTLGEAAWLAFCADVRLGSLTDLSWFAPPNDVEAAVPRARREVGERALYRHVLERRATLSRAHGRLQHQPSTAAQAKRGMSFGEFLQALLLACWRRVAAPSAADLAAAGEHARVAVTAAGAGPVVPSKGALARAVRDVLGRGVLPHAARLDVLPFRRAIASSPALHAAAHALQPVLAHVFQRCFEAEAGRREPHAHSASGSAASVTLGGFSRLLVAAGVLEQAPGVGGFSAAYVVGAFVASLPSHSATALDYA